MTDFNLYNFSRDGRTHGWSHQLKPQTFVDLGLPSGKLWSKEIVKGKDSVPYMCKFENFHNFLRWFIPQQEDFKELWECCKWEWNEKRPGFNVIGPNGKKIFINAKGWINEAVEYKAENVSACLWFKNNDGVNCYNSLCLTKEDLNDCEVEEHPGIIWRETSPHIGLALLLVKKP